VNVTVNGVARDLPAGASVAEVLDVLQVASRSGGIAVAVDGEVVRRGEWATAVLRDGSRVEVLGAIGGGR
jgi:sulfur carrier protein